ncbi:flavin reductase [Nonomuraea sp. NPDC050310]|uniref:flavin reductase n=1 Tax=Nonomuraea sp. NPDC050310 TaxID=3154935 RepID=UPI0033FE4676
METDFRAVMAQWPSGVVIVTTGAAGHWHGMTASAFSSVSLDPPMVLVCLARGTRTHHLVGEHGGFAVSILGKDQAALGRRFAGHHPDHFAGHAWTTALTGAPVLGDAVGWLDCRVAHAYPGGDHTIFVGEVLASATPRRVAPVLFHSRTWSHLADPLPDRISVADTGLLAALRGRGVEATPLARLLRGAGMRVRLAGPWNDPARRTDAGQELDPATASALVDRPGQIGAVVKAGAGVVEFVAGRPGPAPPRADAATAPAEGGEDAEARVVEAARRAGLATVAHLPDSFAGGDGVTSAIARLAALGCDEIALEEGGSPATPIGVRRLLQDASAAAGGTSLRVGLRERHGIGLVNALVAMKSGVWQFDTTLGGVDGALPAEDVLFLAGELEVDSAVDRAALVAGAAELESSWGSALPGRTYRFAC